MLNEIIKELFFSTKPTHIISFDGGFGLGRQVVMKINMHNISFNQAREFRFIRSLDYELISCEEIK